MEELIDLRGFGLSEEELFAFAGNEKEAAEHIDAPKYSYWNSVFRVFFRKKLNIFLLILLAAVIAFSFIYPAVIGYDSAVDPYVNLLDPGSKHLTPRQAMEKFGPSLKWVLGTG